VRLGDFTVLAKSEWFLGSGEKKAMPLIEQFLLDLIAPPVLATLWWLLSRAWGTAVQGGQVSESTKIRQKRGFLVMLTLLYLIGFGTTTYLNFVR
jgi:hypothetical protein